MLMTVLHSPSANSLCKMSNRSRGTRVMFQQVFCIRAVFRVCCFLQARSSVFLMPGPFSAADAFKARMPQSVIRSGFYTFDS